MLNLWEKGVKSVRKGWNKRESKDLLFTKIINGVK